MYSQQIPFTIFPLSIKTTKTTRDYAIWQNTSQWNWEQLALMAATQQQINKETTTMQ